MKRLWLVVIAVLVGAAGITAVLESSRRVPGDAGHATKAAYPLTLTDDNGKRMSLPAKPSKIASYAPQFTELLIRLGLTNKIVAVSGAESFPAAATALTKVTGPDGVTPDLVRLGQLSPDVVIASGADAGWMQSLRSTGIPVFTLNAASVEDAVKDLQTVALIATGSRASAARIIDPIRAEIDKLEKAAARPRRKVFIETFNAPLLGAEDSPYLVDIIRLLHADLIHKPGPPQEPWTLNQIASADPDVYIAASSSAVSAEAIAARPGFDGLRCIQSGHVAVIDDGIWLRPGPRLAEGLKRIAALVIF